MKVHVFAPNIVIDITYYLFEAGQKLGRYFTGKLHTTEPNIYPDAIKFLLSIRARCPSIFISIAIELTVSVALNGGFKKAGSVLSDIGDSWDKDF